MTAKIQIPVGWLGLVLGLALLAGGLLVPDMALWRLMLLCGLWLLSLLPRARAEGRPPRERALLRLGVVFGLGFGAVALQLVREQVIQAADVRARTAALLQPDQRPDTARTLRPADRTSLGAGRVWPVALAGEQRGRILDRAGVVLAETRGGLRVYPRPDLGLVTGFQSRLYGLSGVERSFDGYLSGSRAISATALLEARLLGTPLDAPAADVALTLDAGLQQVAEAALGQRRGAAALIDPASGAVLALASYPRFDPNRLVLPARASEADVARVQAAWQELNAQPDSPLLNRAAQGRYAPGSVIKTLTAAAALDSGVLAGPQGQVTCPNRLATEAGAPPVRNAVENLARFTGDPSDLRRVFAFSCNTAFAQLGLALGPQRFGDYAARFGLGFADQPAAADLRDIAADAGTVAGAANFLQRRAALADTAYGQGQALVTPLDMARMVGLIANDGRLMRPYLVQEARAGGRVLYRAQPEQLRQAISPQAARDMRSVMLTSVEIGYAKPVALPGVTIGAKTGTAETSSGVPHSWFVAIAPLEQPRFALAVIVENGGEGSRNALPVAREILAAALGVKP
jgi:peptidoglycan glycosyltransferase